MCDLYRYRAYHYSNNNNEIKKKFETYYENNGTVLTIFIKI